MSNKRAYWGDLRLWYAAINYVESTPRGASITVPGIDRTEALHIHTSPNFGGDVEIHTVFLPSALTQEDHRARVAAMLTALEARAGLNQPAHPLVWVADNARSRVVDSYAAPVVTSAGHGFANGDVVLMRRLGPGLYGVGYVSNVTANTFTVVFENDWGGGYAVQGGDDILLVERVWAGHGYQGMGPLPLDPASGGDYFAADTVYTFSGSRASGYTRTVVDLDEDMG